MAEMIIYRIMWFGRVVIPELHLEEGYTIYHHYTPVEDHEQSQLHGPPYKYVYEKSVQWPVS